ncbi:hypothetical protein KA082_01045, partial [Candidatus Woesebacteria bacterium]|nr:hypothetical protein [Candidatus Woesebacteria bacterium]
MNQEHFIHTPESLAEPHDSVLAIQLFKLRAALDHLIRHMIFQATGQNIDRILNPLSLVNMALTTPELRSVEVIQSQLSALQLADTQLTQLYAKLLETYQKSIDIMLALNELINTLPTVVGELCTILEELSAQEAFGALSANGSYLLKGPTAVSPDLAGTMAEKILNELHAQTFRSLTTNQPQFPVIIQNDEIITIPSVLQKGIDTEQLPQLPIALESYSLERGNAELVRNFNHNPQKTTREVMHTLSATVERIFNSAYLSSHNGQQLWLSPDDIQTEKERVLQTLNSDSRNLIPLLEQYTKEGDLLAGVSAILEKVLFRSDIAAVYTDTRTNDG